MRAPVPPWRCVWRSEPKMALAALWNDARDRTALSEASAAVDAALERDPTDVGESRLALEDATRFRADIRVAFFGPLRVEFALSRLKREVTVTSVTRTRPGPTERRD